MYGMGESIKIGEIKIREKDKTFYNVARPINLDGIEVFTLFPIKETMFLHHEYISIMNHPSWLLPLQGELGK